MISLFLTALLGLFCCSSINYNAVDHTKEIEVKENCIKQVYYPQGQEGNPLWIPYTIFFDNYYYDNPNGFYHWAVTEWGGYGNSSYQDSYYDVTMPYNTLFVNVDAMAYSSYVQNGGVGINYLTNNSLAVDYIRLYKCDDTTYRGLGDLQRFMFNTSSATFKPYYKIINYPGVYGGQLYNTPSSSGFVFASLDKGIMILSNNPLYQIFNHDYENSNQSYDEGYADGYNYGYDWGKQVGMNDAERAGYADGYADGKQDGYAEGLEAQTGYDPVALTIFTGIIEVGLLPVNVFLQILNFEVFGINIGGLVTSLLTIAIVIIIIRFVTGKKND